MSLLKFLKDFESLFYSDIVRRKKTTPFLIFIFLLASFFLSRVFVIYFPERSIFIKGYHIHHFFFGLIMVLFAGYVSLVSNKANLHRISAILYGIGLGMMLDEIGLFLTCGTISKGCDYWARITYDVLIFFVAVFLSIIYFEPFWKRMGKTIINFLMKIKNFFLR